jgi:DNA helicase HerA-like ATPase
LKLYRKEGDTVQVLCFPEEKVEKGDYLLIEDLREKRSLLIQVYDIQFVNMSGIMEDLLRDAMTEEQVVGDDYDPLQLDSQIVIMKDARLLLGKIRCSMENGKISTNVSWLPSRATSRIFRYNLEEIVKVLEIGKTRPINIGESKSGSEIKIDADNLDGKLTIITGKKGTGKSHLSKALILGLIDHKAPCVIFDINGEYVNLTLSDSGEKNRYYDKIIVLDANKNFRTTLTQAGLTVTLNILIHSLDLPGTSARVFSRIWKFLEQNGSLSLKNLGKAIQDWDCNEHIRDALFSRFYTLLGSNFFTDNEGGLTTLENSLTKISEGGAAIINLKETSSTERKIVVEYTLGKLVELLKQWKIRAIFLFAEEAHLYLRETYWEDIVTRMRHLGLFATFITNQPDSINESIYRQADSIFLFNFKNEHDLEAISKVARIDSETVKSIAQSLEPYHCLIIGQATKELPIVVKVKKLNVKTMGETRKFFKNENN